MTTIAEITGRDRTDEQTRRLAAVVRDANDAVIVQAFDGRIVAWNHGAERLYGWSGSEALAMNFRDIVPEPERQEARKLVERLVRGEPVSSLEMQRVTRDGRILDVWLTVTVLRDADGQPSSIATIERDITARKRAQATLRQREMNLRAFLESAPDGMVVADEGGTIISDYRLPGGRTGLEVIQQIRTAVGRKLPAILMTGDTAGARLCEAEESGCRLVHKPAREGDLLPIIRELLQQGDRPGVMANAAAPGVSGCAGDARSRRR